MIFEAKPEEVEQAMRLYGSISKYKIHYKICFQIILYNLYNCNIL